MTVAAAPPETNARRVGRWLLIAFYGVAGVMHFVATAAMVKIVPHWVPMPALVVQATGLCELAGAVGLITVRRRRAAGWALAAYAVCVFPANIVHLMHDLGTGTGLGVWYHYPRMVAQPLIVWWALWASGAMWSRVK